MKVSKLPPQVRKIVAATTDTFIAALERSPKE
jgi:hypothetical protein